jgi:RHS repeat-associated protein
LVGRRAGADVDGTNALAGVSCPSTTFCAAVDGKGNVVTYNGSAWAAAKDIDSTRALKAVSCPSASFCAAVDGSGYAVTYNGTSWSTPSDIDGSHVLQTVSCTASSACDATDSTGNLLTYNGSAWSTATDIDAARSLTGMSCTSTSLCAAVDGSGYATVYSAVVNAVQLTWNATRSLPVILSDGSYYYVYGSSDSPVEQVSVRSSTPTFMSFVPANSSWVTTSAAGGQTGFWRYDAFGNLASGSPTSAFGYAGQYQDSGSGSTGLYNMRARWYEPQTATFDTPDPMAAVSGAPYNYAKGDPIDNTDPTGMYTVGVCGGAAAGAAAIAGIAINGSLCLVRTVFTPRGNDDIGITESVGYGNVGVGVGAGLSLTYQVSTASTLQSLAHWFYNADITWANPLSALTGGIGISPTASVFWSDTKPLVIGANIGVSLGAGGGAFLTSTNTWVQEAHNPALKVALRVLWDALVPPPLQSLNSALLTLPWVHQAAWRPGSGGQ